MCERGERMSGMCELYEMNIHSSINIEVKLEVVKK